MEPTVIPSTNLEVIKSNRNDDSEFPVCSEVGQCANLMLHPLSPFSIDYFRRDGEQKNFVEIAVATS